MSSDKTMTSDRGRGTLTGRRRTSGRSGILVLLSAAAVWIAAPAQAQPERLGAAPVGGAVFNDPNSAQNKFAISNKLKSLIGSADRGSTIQIAIYEFHDASIMDALKAAKERNGVKIQVVADSESRTYANGDPNPTWKALESTFGTNRSAGSWVMTCPPARACVGPGKLMHNKFALFSSVGGAKVVFQSSANFYVSGSGNGNWNNAMTVVGNAGLYKSYRRYFDDLKNMRRTNDQYNRYPDSAAVYGKFKPYYFPRAGSGPSTDTIVSILDNVDCKRRDNASTGTSHHQTIVRVAMAFFTRTDVAEKLRAMDNAGCFVQVIYTKDNAAPSVEKILLDHSNRTYSGIQSWCFRPGTETTVHSKYLAIEGNYAGARDKKLVWTGSHNYTGAALRGNDEALLRIADNGVHDAFRKNFRDMAYGAPGIKSMDTSPSCS